MKKISLILLFAVSILTSCEDSYKIENPGQVDPADTYKTMDGLRKNLKGVYATIGYEDAIEFSSIFTDEVGIGYANGGQGLNDGAYAYQLLPSSDAPEAIWASCYNTINNCNRFLQGAKNLEAEYGTDLEYKLMLAQVRTIRAFSYFQLLSYFSEDIKNPNALGVMLFTDVPGIDSPKIPRSKNSEVFALINDDLAYATPLLITLNLNNVYFNNAGSIFYGAKPYYYISENMIKAFKARMYTYIGDYVNAELYANQVIASLPITLRSNYLSMWNDSAQGECIFNLSRSTSDRKVGQIWASVNATATGSPFFEVGRSLFNLFRFPDENDSQAVLPSSSSQGIEDIRKWVLTNPTARVSSDYQVTGDYRNDDVLPVGKYARTESTNLLADIKVFRTSEMMLIKAEAQIYANNLTGAATTIRTLRVRRINSTTGPIPTPVYANQQAAYRDLLIERRKELSFEGHRYQDLKRLAVLANVSVDRDSRDCAFNNSCFFSNTDHRWVLPIPTSELVSNPLIVQNPGY